MASTSLSDFKSCDLWRAVTAECLGTLFLVVLGCGSCLHDIGSVGICLCFGLTIVAVVWSIADVSGGHINPAVTLAFLVTRRISILKAIFYIIAQVVGAILGSVILKALTPSNLQGNLGCPALGNSVTQGQGFGVELLITFIFVFVIFSAVDGYRKSNSPATLMIGFALLACHLFAVPITGSGMNPARSFGPCLISKAWDNHWIYWVGPIVGGILAGLLYDLLYAGNSSRSKVRGFFKGGYDNDHYDNNGSRSHENGSPETTELRA